MKKICFRIFLAFIVLFMLIWGIAILKCEILTYKYGYQFNTIYQENTMIGEIEYFKVLEYSDTYARVYYVSKNSGNVLTFSKKSGEWKYDKWEQTVWSKTGSADDFIWPYIL